MTRGGAVRELLDPPTCTPFAFWGPFFLSVFLHPLFHNKITFVSKLVPKMIPKSLPNLTLGPFFLIFWKPCFGTTLHGFYYILGFPPSRKGTRNTTKTKPGKDNKQTCEFRVKNEEFLKNDSKMVSKNVTRFPAIPLWRLWWHLWRPSLFFHATNEAQASKSDPKVAKVTPKGDSKW